MKAEVHVTLKTGVLDPQGKAIAGAISSLGHEGVSSVRLGKYFEIELEEGVGDPQALLDEISDKLLANPVIEDFRAEIVK